MNTNLYKELALFVNTGNKGKNNYSCISKPFFMQEKDKVNETGYNLEKINKVTSLSIMLTVFSKGRFQHA